MGVNDNTIPMGRGLLDAARREVAEGMMARSDSAGMEHMIDVIREPGLKVTVIYRNRGEVAWTRTRPYKWADEHEETEADQTKIAQWLLDKGYAAERDLVTIFDEQAVHGNWHGMPFEAVVGVLAKRGK